MTQRVLHLGWKPVADVEALHALGAQVTCAVLPADLAAARESPYPHRVVPVADPTSAEAVVAGLARCALDLSEFDVVSPANELELVAASLLGALVGAPGVPYQTALALRDKFVQKARVRAAGVPVTECRVLESLEVTGLDLFDGGRVVIKPLAGAGTENTFVLSDAADLAAVPVASGSPGLWLMERYVEGQELHFDGVIRKGELLDVAVSRYLNNVISIKSGREAGSVTLRPERYGDLYQRVGDLVRRVLEALSYADGVFHGEAFLRPDGSLVFSELGGRVGGGGISVVWKQVRGIDLHDEWARSILGLPSSLPVSDGEPPRATGWIHLKSRPGRVVAAPTVAEVEERPGVIYGEVKLKVGEVAPDIASNSSNRAGRVVVVGPDEEAVETRLREVSAWFFAHVKVEEPESASNGTDAEGSE